MDGWTDGQGCRPRSRCPTRIPAHLPIRPSPHLASSMPPAPAAWLRHLQDEADAAFLYRELAGAEPDPERREIYRQLAEVEDRHVAAWRALLAEQGHAAPTPAPSGGARFRAWPARRVGGRAPPPLPPSRGGP